MSATLHPIVAEYHRLGMTLERAVYTPVYDGWIADLISRGIETDHRAAYVILRDARKRKLLPRAGRGPNNTLALPPADILLRCQQIIGVAIDDLPYSNAMDRLVRMARETAPGLISPWQVWWGLLDARKGIAKSRRAARST
jgi:hypothetical protein